jgi:hypothetical protein
MEAEVLEEVLVRVLGVLELRVVLILLAAAEAAAELEILGVPQLAALVEVMAEEMVVVEPGMVPAAAELARSISHH